MPNAAQVADITARQKVAFVYLCFFSTGIMLRAFCNRHPFFSWVSASGLQASVCLVPVSADQVRLLC